MFVFSIFPCLRFFAVCLFLCDVNFQRVRLRERACHLVVFIAGVAVVNNTADTASACGIPHTNTQTAGGSPNVNVGDP